MKKQKLLLLLLAIALVGTSACTTKKRRSSGGGGNSGRTFELPVVDVDNITINLPPMPTFDTTSPVKREGDYDIIDIYEVSDMHAMINYDTQSTHGYFGFSGLANFFSEKRTENAGTIVISSGDMWQGGTDSNMTRGRVVAEGMRYVGFEAMALGNHEFDWGEDVIKRNANYFKDEMPLMAGNLIKVETGAMPDYLVPSRVIERGGYKIGVIGTIGGVETSIAKNVFDGIFKINDSEDFAKEEAKRLREEENCDAVVWMSHEGAAEAHVPDNIDAFFGGHVHLNLDDTQAETNVGHEVAKLCTKNYGSAIAHATLKMNKDTKKCVDVDGEIIEGKNNLKYLTDEANVKNLLSQYDEVTKPVKGYQLNKVSGTFRKGEELANLSCKAMFDTFKDDSTIAAIQNGNGGVRNDITAGMVTYDHVATSFPFDNEIVYIVRKGSQLKDFFDDIGNLNLYVSTTKFSDFERDKEYKILTTDYVCTNKLGLTSSQYTPFPGSVIRDVVAKFIFDNSGLKADNFNKSKVANYAKPS